MAIIHFELLQLMDHFHLHLRLHLHAAQFIHLDHYLNAIFSGHFNYFELQIIILHSILYILHLIFLAIRHKFLFILRVHLSNNLPFFLLHLAIQINLINHSFPLPGALCSIPCLLVFSLISFRFLFSFHILCLHSSFLSFQLVALAYVFCFWVIKISLRRLEQNDSDLIYALHFLRYLADVFKD